MVVGRAVVAASPGDHDAERRTPPRLRGSATRPGAHPRRGRPLRPLPSRGSRRAPTDAGVVRQRSRGKLTCRERIALLLDEGSFREVEAWRVRLLRRAGQRRRVHAGRTTSAAGAVGGRPAVVCADDFTSRGGHADGAICAKSLHFDRLSLELRAPSVRMLDGSSGGGSMAAMVPQRIRRCRAGDELTRRVGGNQQTDDERCCPQTLCVEWQQGQDDRQAENIDKNDQEDREERRSFSHLMWRRSSAVPPMLRLR